MSGREKYTFVIDGFKPGTMPFDRLVEYYTELAKLFGAPQSIHLEQIKESSHASVLTIDARDSQKVGILLDALKRDDAPGKQVRARDRIASMLDEDRTTGRISDAKGAVVLPFRPTLTSAAKRTVTLVDMGSVTGDLYYMNADKDPVSFRIKQQAGGVVQCHAGRDMAKRLIASLTKRVRVFGQGEWTRNARGDWEIQHFEIHDFTELERGELGAAIKDIRSMELKWRDDPLGYLAELNEEDGLPN